MKNPKPETQNPTPGTAAAQSAQRFIGGEFVAMEASVIKVHLKEPG